MISSFVRRIQRRHWKDYEERRCQICHKPLRGALSTFSRLSRLGRNMVAHAECVFSEDE